MPNSLVVWEIRHAYDRSRGKAVGYNKMSSEQTNSKVSSALGPLYTQDLKAIPNPFFGGYRNA